MKRLKAPDIDDEMEAHHQLELTAWAWLTVVRVKVRELAAQAGKLDAILAHPARWNKLVCALDEDGVRAFITAVAALDDSLGQMLAGDHEPFNIPDLMAALRPKPTTGGPHGQRVFRSL